MVQFVVTTIGLMCDIPPPPQKSSPSLLLLWTPLVLGPGRGGMLTNPRRKKSEKAVEVSDITVFFSGYLWTDTKLCVDWEPDVIINPSWPQNADRWQPTLAWPLKQLHACKIWAMTSMEQSVLSGISGCQKMWRKTLQLDIRHGMIDPVLIARDMSYLLTQRVLLFRSEQDSGVLF